MSGINCFANENVVKFRLTDTDGNKISIKSVYGWGARYSTDSGFKKAFKMSSGLEIPYNAIKNLIQKDINKRMQSITIETIDGSVINGRCFHSGDELKGIAPFGETSIKGKDIVLIEQIK